MLHNTLSALLVSVASRYAQLSPSDVGIGIGGGRLVIDDVQLRTDTFNGPNTPFDVQHGRAGRLRVNVPWGALSSSPVQVYLENVHLIATPKNQPPPTDNNDDDNNNNNDKNKSDKKISQSSSSTSSNSTSTSTSTSTVNERPWHQTNVGRLLFNVSIEIYGLKIEYRDQHCIGVLSIASLRAFSAGPDWSMRFVSLVPDLDRDQPDASAVAMRKTVNLTGVHFVMIPRAKLNSNKTSTNDVDVPHRNLDFHSFESQNPILDGVSIALRVLLCTGATVLPDTGQLTPGMHGEVFVEIDEPSVKLTARQLLWLEDILRQALDNGDDDNENQNQKKPSNVKITVQNGASDGGIQNNHDISTSSKTGNEDMKRPRRPASTGDRNDHDDYVNEDEISQNNTINKNVQSAPELGTTTNNNNDDDDGDDKSSNKKSSGNERGSLRTVWEAIVGENTDETVDDAAIALGLWKDTDDSIYTNGSARRRRQSQQKSKRNSTDKNHENNEDDETHNVEDEDEEEEEDDYYDDEDEEEEDEEDEEDEQEEGDDDKRYARRAVKSAAECGGVTWHVRLRTADTRAWNKVKDLEKEVAAAKEGAKRAEEADKARIKAEERENEQRKQLQKLIQRNNALAKELGEFEQLASEAGKNKDSLIRELQGALAKAEQSLTTVISPSRPVTQHTEVEDIQGYMQHQDTMYVDETGVEIPPPSQQQQQEQVDLKNQTPTVTPETQATQATHVQGIETRNLEEQLEQQLRQIVRASSSVDNGTEVVEENVNLTAPVDSMGTGSADEAEGASNGVRNGEILEKGDIGESGESTPDGVSKAAEEQGQEEEQEEVVVLGDDRGNLPAEDENAEEIETESKERTDGNKLSVVEDIAQNASLQSFFNNEDVSKIEQRMGIEGLTLI